MSRPRGLVAQLTGCVGIASIACLIALLSFLYSMLNSKGPPQPPPRQSPSPRRSPRSSAPIHVATPIHSRSSTPAATPSPSRTSAADLAATPSPRATSTATPAPSRSAAPMYAEIDRHAVTAPASVEVDIPTLTDYLVRPARTDREKARVIFRWIAERIAYDVQAYTSKKIPDQSAQATLKNHLAVCAGYANLFQAMATHAGLKSEIVRGHCKGMGSDDSFSQDNSHAWNALRLDGSWHLLDSTWGGGRLNSGKVYERAFEEFYFMAPPEKLIYTHFPSEPRWQCLATPVTAEEFLYRPKLTPGFFKAGLKLLDPQQSVIQARASFRVVLQGPADLSVLGQLGEHEHAVLVSRQGETFTLDVSPPEPGTYVLHVFAGASGGKVPGVLDFRVKAQGAAEGPLPEAFRGFEQYQVELRSPRQGNLSSRRSEHFDLKIPGATEVFVGGQEGNRLPLQHAGQTFRGDVKLRPGTATVYAQFPSDSNRYQGLLRYQVR